MTTLKCSRCGLPFDADVQGDEIALMCKWCRRLMEREGKDA